MRKDLIVTSLFAATLLMSACGKKSNKDMLVGTWSLTGVTDNGKTEDVGSKDMQAVFNKDGSTYTFSGTSKDTLNKDTYKLSDDEKTIMIYETGESAKADPETMTIVSLTGDALKLSNKKGEEMTFKKK